MHEFTDQSLFVAAMVAGAGAIMEVFTDEV